MNLFAGQNRFRNAPKHADEGGAVRRREEVDDRSVQVEGLHRQTAEWKQSIRKPEGESQKKRIIMRFYVAKISSAFAA